MPNMFSPTGIPGSVSPLTTKGDIWSYSSVDARLPVGADNKTLVADSTATIGQTYTYPIGKNYISNPSFESNSITKWSLAHSALTSAFPTTVSNPGAVYANAQYIFTITPATAGAGSTYTNNGQTFTVVTAESSGTILVCTGTGAPTASGTLTFSSGSPSGNITYSAFQSTTITSSNLTATVISSGQLNGAYSLSYSDTTGGGTTAGDMLLSNAFSIDLQDQAKILTVKFYYSAITGASTANWSGTSSNSFGIALYDVANGAWVMPAGVWGMTQSSGVGYCTATFQTASNATQYQLAVYNSTATSASTKVYFDDFYCGPITAPIGTVITDWVAYTPTISGFGTVSAVTFYSRRVGGSLEVKGGFTAGTVAGTQGQIGLGFQGGAANVTVDTAKTQVSSMCGILGRNQVSSTYFGAYILVPSANQTYVNFSAQTSALNAETALNGNSFLTGDVLQCYFSVPIVGWQSNVQMSSDTDTRVIAARMTGATATVTGSYSDVTWTTIVNDTAGAMGAINYTIPISGYYNITGALYISATTIAAGNVAAVSLFNTTTSTTLLESSIDFEGTNNASMSLPFSFAAVYFNSGVQIKIQTKSATTSPVITSSATQNFLAIQRISGPSVVAATESVNARYFACTTAPGTIASPIQLTYTTKTTDTHNAYASGTYTIPVSGKYLVNAGCYQTAATTAANQACAIFIYYNGAAYASTEMYITSTTSKPISNWVSDIVSCNAGDTVKIYAGNAGTTPSMSASNNYNYFSICRIGN